MKSLATGWLVYVNLAMVYYLFQFGGDGGLGFAIKAVLLAEVVFLTFSAMVFLISEETQ